MATVHTPEVVAPFMRRSELHDVLERNYVKLLKAPGNADSYPGTYPGIFSKFQPKPTFQKTDSKFQPKPAKLASCKNISGFVRYDYTPDKNSLLSTDIYCEMLFKITCANGEEDEDGVALPNPTLANGWLGFGDKGLTTSRL